VGGFQSELANGSIICKNLHQSGSLGFINIDDQPGNMNGMLIYAFYLNGLFVYFVAVREKI